MKTITLHDDATITVDGKEYVPKELDAPTKPERVLWTPKDCETHWLLDDEGSVEDYTWEGECEDVSWLKAGNIFPTLEHAEAAKRHREAQSVIDRYCYAKGIDTRWKQGAGRVGARLFNDRVEYRTFDYVCAGSPFWVESKALAEQIIADCGDEIRMVLLRGWV